MNKNIILTGGCGFIAKNLIIELLKKNHKKINKIICIDNFISSLESEFTKFVSLIQKKYDDKIILYKKDITKYNDFQLIMNDLIIKHDIYKVDEIYHLASIASPVLYKQYPLETLDCGYIGTKNVLDCAKFYDSKVLFCSTSEVYGDAKITPQPEYYYGNVNSFGARSCYDESKRVAEALCYSYIQIYKMDIKIARIFNTYGPHMMLEDGRIITECIKHLMNNTPLTVFGDGTQTRSICMVDDTAQMMIELMASSCNDPVNIGNNEELTVNEIVKIIENQYKNITNKNVDLKIQYLPLTQNDPLQRCPDLTFNKEILGNRNYTPMTEGLSKTIKYFIENFSV